MHPSHSLRFKTSRKHLGHSFVIVTFCPNDAPSYQSLDEWSEVGRFSIFVDVASEDVGDDFWIGCDKLLEGVEYMCSRGK